MNEVLFKELYVTKCFSQDNNFKNYQIIKKIFWNKKNNTNYSVAAKMGGQ